MGNYAKKTTVNSIQSKAEIEKILKLYGCENIHDANSVDQGWMVEFKKENRLVRIQVVYPTKSDPEIATSHNGKRERTDKQMDDAIEQEIRRRFRCLVIYLKGKFEYLDSGLSYFEKEFFGHIVDPVRKITMAEMLEEEVENRYLGNDVQPMIRLPAPTK